MLRRFLILGLGPIAALCVATGVAQAAAGGGSTAAAGTLALPVFPATSSTTPAFDVYDTGFSCGLYGSSTTDSAAYAEQYLSGSSTFYNYALACVADTGSTTVTHTEEPPKSCNDNSGAPARLTPGELATFADGETVLVCDSPDASKSGHRRGAGRHPLTFVAQGFKCESTVGTGPTDSHATEIKNHDSIEFAQAYKYHGLTGLTAACVGTVPAATVVSTTIVSHELGCSMYDPSAPGTVRGYGESFTFPDHQFEETCQIPNYAKATVDSKKRGG